MAGITLDVHSADKEVQPSREGEPHVRAGRSNFSLNVGKAPGGEQDANAFSNLIAVERLTHLLREHLQQVVSVRHTGQFYGLDGTSGVKKTSAKNRMGALRHGRPDRAKA